MSISRQDLFRVARLAELDVPDGDVERLSEQLAQIVSYVGQLETASDATAPLVVGAQQAALREDVVAPIPLAHSPEVIAPAMVDGFFVVPRLAAMEEE